MRKLLRFVGRVVQLTAAMVLAAWFAAAGFFGIYRFLDEGITQAGVAGVGLVFASFWIAGWALGRWS